MKFETILKGAVPVVVGVIAAGLLLNALRDMEFFRNATRGFDS